MRYFATYLIYIAVIARAIGWNQETAPIPIPIWTLLAIFGAFLFSQQPLTRRFPSYPRLYTLVQSALAITMLYRAPTLDFLSMLLLPLCFQAVQFFGARIGFIWIAGLILALSGMVFFGLEWQAGLTTIITGAGTGFLMGSFAYLITRTEQRRRDNQHLFADLQEAYRRLKNSAAQSEELAAASERHRLVRELHDSLTQTLFSMNLAVQSARLSIGENPLQSGEHLLRLQALTRSAASEVQALLGRIPQGSLARGELVSAIQQLAEERKVQDGLQVAIEATGKRDFPDTVTENLFRITQEALNNISRHAGVRQALVRLCLESPVASLEIIDHGCGFNQADSLRTGGFGLSGMAARAREIGWLLKVETQPGHGTTIHAEEKTS
ncbi:MAG: sensor histidine kinase [Acidobacteriaceae bacterium]